MLALYIFPQLRALRSVAVFLCDSHNFDSLTKCILWPVRVELYLLAVRVIVLKGQVAVPWQKVACLNGLSDPFRFVYVALEIFLLVRKQKILWLYLETEALMHPSDLPAMIPDHVFKLIAIT